MNDRPTYCNNVSHHTLNGVRMDVWMIWVYVNLKVRETYYIIFLLKSEPAPNKHGVRRVIEINQCHACSRSLWTSLSLTYLCPESLNLLICCSILISTWLSYLVTLISAGHVLPLLCLCADSLNFLICTFTSFVLHLRDYPTLGPPCTP